MNITLRTFIKHEINARRFFVDISNMIDKKLAAIRCYKSQIDTVPSRSPIACKALAQFRGSQNGFEYAEAFKIVRIAI